jgi:hypothetical protein
MTMYIPATILYFYYLDHDVEFPSSSSTTTGRGVLLTQFLPGMSIAFSTIGAINLVLLTIFDTARYSAAHKTLLPTSIIAHILGAGVLCAYTMLRLRQHRRTAQSRSVAALDKFTVELYPATLAAPPISIPSLIVKTVIGVSEFTLVMLFAITTWDLKTFDTAAVMEWTVVLLFGGYMACLVVDFWVLRNRGPGFGRIV